MKTRSSTYLPLPISILVAGLLNACVPGENYDQDFSMKELSSMDDSRIFIKKKIWGMTGDNQIIAISASTDSTIDENSSTNYLYRGLSPFFYKINQDTLSIYTTKASPIPANFKTTFKIVQYELQNAEMMDLVTNANYSKRGLKTLD